jgi:hypothetical protein
MKRKHMISMLPVVCFALCLAVNVVSAMDQTNQELLAVDIGVGSNLVLTSISGPAKVFLNQTISVTYEVTNQGDVDSGAYQVGLYLSKDTTIDPAADCLLREITFPGGIAAGQTEKATTKVTIPRSGLYYYGGVVGSSSTASLKKVSIVRFEADSLNGTVTDHKTGLMWQQADDGITRTWSEAETYCNGLVLGGYEDWRLPGIKGLLSIVDYSRYDPAIHSPFDVRSGHYWSSSANVYYPANAWHVYFVDGSANWDFKSYLYYVRCVRGEPANCGR